MYKENQSGAVAKLLFGTSTYEPATWLPQCMLLHDHAWTVNTHELHYMSRNSTFASTLNIDNRHLESQSIHWQARQITSGSPLCYGKTWLRYLHPKTIGSKTDLFWSEWLERQIITYTYCYIWFILWWWTQTICFSVRVWAAHRMYLVCNVKQWSDGVTRTHDICLLFYFFLLIYGMKTMFLHQSGPTKYIWYSVWSQVMTKSEGGGNNWKRWHLFILYLLFILWWMVNTNNLFLCQSMRSPSICVWCSV